MEPKKNPPAFQNCFPQTTLDLVHADSEWLPCRKTTGTIKFIAALAKWETEKPFNLALPLPQGQPKTNSIYEPHEVQISDVRGRETQFSLDVHGFAFVISPPENSTFRDRDEIESKYLPHMERFLKDYFGAEKVQAFDYVLREVKRDRQGYKWHEKRPPAMNAHTDQTPEAALSRLRLYFGDKADELAKGRVRFVNIWRPLIQPLEDTPLAVLDARSLRNEDLLAHDIVYAHYVGENYLVKYNSNHRWYYQSLMRTEECIIIKNFDSDLGNTARMCPHAAFIDASSPPNSQPRESIEARFMVFN